MISTVFGRLPDAPARIGLGPAALEEADVRRPGDVHEDGHPALIDQIEQPLRRDMIGSDRVGPERLHPRQIIADALPRGERLTVRSGANGP